MPLGERSHFQNPFERNDDTSHASIFLIAIALLVGVAAILFHGSRWALPTDTSSLSASLRRVPPQVQSASAASGVNARPTQSTSPSTSSPAGPAAPAVAPTAVARDAAAAPSTPIATATASPKPTQTPGQAGSRRGVVANSGNEPVFLRRTPSLSDRLLAWPDETPLQLLGEETDSQGIRWLKVRDPRGNVGWLPRKNVQVVE